MVTGVEVDKEEEEVETLIVMVAIEAFEGIEVVEGEGGMIATETSRMNQTMWAVTPAKVAIETETAKKTIVKGRTKGKDRRNRLVLGWLTTKKTSQRSCDSLTS